MILFQILFERNFSPVVTYLLHSYIFIRLNSYTLIHLVSLSISPSRFDFRKRWPVQILKGKPKTYWVIFTFNIAIIGKCCWWSRDELTTDRNQVVIQLVRKQFRIWPTEWGMNVYIFSGMETTIYQRSKAKQSKA